MNRSRHAQQLGFFDFARQCVTELVIQPVKDADPVLLRKTESGFAAVVGIDADIERKTLTLPVLIHELRYRSTVTGQEPPANERVALRAEMRHLERRSQAFGEPRD